MTVAFGAEEAETHFTELLARVEAGEQITLTKDGRPVARLIPIVDEGAQHDWHAFWARVDSHIVDVPAHVSIKDDIEAGRLRADIP